MKDLWYSLVAINMDITEYLKAPSIIHRALNYHNYWHKTAVEKLYCMYHNRAGEDLVNLYYSPEVQRFLNGLPVKELE